MADCAAELGRGASTVSMIASSDTFKTYHSQRKQEFQRGHDDLITSKLFGIANDGLEAMHNSIKKRGDQIPMQVLAPLMTSVLDRLGFAPKVGPAVVIDASTNNDNRTVNLPPTVSAATLEEARMAMRMVEQQKLRSLPPPIDGEVLRGGGEAEVGSAEPALVDAGTVNDLEVEPDAPTDRS
jgi:hypothetical protein